MRTSQAARLARWSAILALVLAGFVAGAYVRRSTEAYRARKFAPASVPSAIQQRSAEFSYSSESGDHPEFTVRASHATEFIAGGRSVLEDVWVTFYGKDGARSDNLHTRTCEFMNTAGTITCEGDVQIDLQSAADAKRFPGTAEHPNPAAHVMHIHTSHVSFNRGTGISTSDQAISFDFPQGHGQANGFVYESGKGEFRLLHDVVMNFDQPLTSAAAITEQGELGGQGEQENPAPAAAGAAAAKPLRVTAASLDYRRDERIIHLQGPVEAAQDPRRLLAGRLDVELDPMLRARRLLASDKPRLASNDGNQPALLTADRFSASLSSEGWIEAMAATGNVRAEIHATGHEDHLSAGRADLEMVPRTNQPRRLLVAQNVAADSEGPGGLHRQLATSTMELQLAGGSGGGDQVRITRAITPAAVLDWRVPADPAAKSEAQYMHLASQHLDALFSAEGDLREVRGSGGVQLERQTGSDPAQSSSSRELVARLAPGGDWSSVDQTGEVRVRQAAQAAQADTAHFDRASDTATLTGSVVLSDPRFRVTARTASFRQLANELRAEGRVVSSEVSASGAGAINLAPSPARISSERLVVNTATGHATYSEQARLWQGDSLIESDRIELDRPTGVVTATGHVQAVFPQAPWTPRGAPAAAGRAASAKPDFIRTQAGKLTYNSAEGQAVLEQRVTTHSSQGSIQADTVNLYFSPASPGAGRSGAAQAAPTVKSVSAQLPPSGPANTPGLQQLGPQQLTHATALGNVIVQQEDRHCTSARADYTASEGKFVLTGGPPVVRDASGNSTTGRELTLFFADDKIVIDSAEGLRTLTLHRVEK